MVQNFFDVEQSASLYHRGFWLLGWWPSKGTLDAHAKVWKNRQITKRPSKSVHAPSFRPRPVDVDGVYQKFPALNIFVK